MAQSRYTIYFTGRVQGVGFRFTTIRIARGYSVAGYVKNLPGRRVELVAEGDTAELDSFVETVLEAMSGHIASHTIDRSAPTGEFGPAEPGNLTIRH